MKTIAFIAASALLATTGFVSVPDAAQAQSRGAPRGSYAETCSGAYVNQGRLYADCLDTRSRARSTSIELAPCSSGDIANENGLLVCPGARGQFESNGGGNNGGGNNGGGWNGGGGNNGGGNNGGGWNGGGWNGGGNNGGGWNGGGGNNGGGWNGGNNGGGRNSITVFYDRDYRGGFQTFRGEQYNLGNTDFNDQISSIQVNGPWEVCSDSGFRGQCQIIEGNVRNLNNTGLNDRISSMRPARGGGRW